MTVCEVVLAREAAQLVRVAATSSSKEGPDELVD